MKTKVRYILTSATIRGNRDNGKYRGRGYTGSLPVQLTARNTVSDFLGAFRTAGISNLERPCSRHGDILAYRYHEICVTVFG